MKLKILIYSLMIISAGIGIKIFAFNSSKGDSITIDEINSMENVLLIDSLEEESVVESESPVEPALTIQEITSEVQNDDAGMIIYDDEFEPAIEKIIESKNNPEQFLNELKKKDKRWHYTEYKIKKGESIWTIAEKFKISHKMIIKANSIKSANLVKPGKILLIPNTNGIFYIVQKNDSLSVIAKKYNVKIDDIKMNNRIKNNRLAAKSKIFIPDAVEKKEINQLRTVNTVQITKMDTKLPTKLTLTPFIRPMKGSLDISSRFGMRMHPILGRRVFHNGLDIRMNVGTKVYSSADGRIIYAGEREGYGNMVVVQHKNNYITVYAHLNDILKDTGTTVKKGELIGLSGETGSVTGPHLHYEIRKNNVPLNPLKFM